MKKTVGIIGGLGPLAGAYFYRRLIEKTPVKGDEGHLPVRIWSSPDLPSRLDHMRGTGPSPVPALVHIAKGLMESGAESLVIPSSTTHHYYRDIAQAVRPTPVINLLEEVALAIVKTSVRSVGILATTPTVEFDLYQGVFQKYGITGHYPDPGSQEEVMAEIMDVKAGRSTSDRAERLIDITQRPWMAPCEGLVLACTEIPVVFSHERWARIDSRALFDATDILVEATIRMSHGDPDTKGDTP